MAEQGVEFKQSESMSHHLPCWCWEVWKITETSNLQIEWEGPSQLRCHGRENITDAEGSMTRTEGCKKDKKAGLFRIRYHWILKCTWTMSVSTQWSGLPVQGNGMKEGNCDECGPGNGERKWKACEGKSLRKKNKIKYLIIFMGMVHLLSTYSTLKGTFTFVILFNPHKTSAKWVLLTSFLLGRKLNIQRG